MIRHKKSRDQSSQINHLESCFTLSKKCLALIFHKSLRGMCSPWTMTTDLVGVPKPSMLPKREEVHYFKWVCVDLPTNWVVTPQKNGPRTSRYPFTHEEQNHDIPQTDDMWHQTIHESCVIGCLWAYSEHANQSQWRGELHAPLQQQLHSSGAPLHSG